MEKEVIELRWDTKVASLSLSSRTLISEPFLHVAAALAACRRGQRDKPDKATFFTMLSMHEVQNPHHLLHAAGKTVVRALGRMHGRRVARQT
jgi:hypothetical protein